MSVAHVVIRPDGVASWDGRAVRVSLGRSGVRADKREGDGATPIGRFPPRFVLYRSDRVGAPVTDLPVRPIRASDGWCDDPTSPDYNRLIALPHPAGHETLSREDHVYDLLLVIGHNDAPPVPGMGSAVFVHLARPDWSPTEGCVAFAEADLRDLLRKLDDRSVIEIQG